VVRHLALGSARGACVRAACLLAAVSVPLRAQPPQPDRVVHDSTRAAAVDRVFVAWSAADGPGCAVGVSQGGAVVLLRGYGAANLELGAPVTPASVFHAASLAKQVTAAAVLLLAREGRLSLDDDVRRFVPELPDYAPQYGRPITIRHLLTHTSGLRDQWDLLYMARGRFEENRITEADVLDIVTRQRALNFAPGAEFMYSNTGYTLAAVVVRRASGQPLRAFAQARLFDPLGMAHTHFHDDYGMVVPGRAAGYARARGAGAASGAASGAAAWRVSLPNFDTYGATNLFTTAGDLLAWAAYLDGRDLGPRRAPDTRLGGAALGRTLAASATLVDGDSTGYGFGVSTERYRGAWLVGHAGADAGYRAYAGRFPEHGLAVAVLCNSAASNPTGMARQVADVFLADRLDPPAPPVSATPSLPAADLARFAGVYADPVTGAPTFITQQGQTLVLGRDEGPALIPLGGLRFRVAGQPVEFAFTSTPAGAAAPRTTSHEALVRTGLGWPPRRPVVLRRRVPARPTRSELARYAGTYRSDELLGATYTVAATDDGTLVLRTRGDLEPITVRPAYGDTFAGDLLVTFNQGRAGRVTGMRMSSGRVRRVQFTRAER
jgi:CubicO group peptidase (beta-lactamase class C family)